jgi:drug/metabolite transporter (DMT)-like permease
MPDRKTQLVGMAAVSVIVCFWSSWLVASRSGTLAGLTIWDIAMLRYAFAGVICVPIVWIAKPWRKLTIGKTLALAVTGGIPYALLTYAGFIFAPAAHGGVFLNGMLPTLTLVIAFLWLREKPGRFQIIGSLLIVCGAAIASVSGIAGSPQSWIGDLFFLAAGLSFAVFLLLQRRWHTDVPQILWTVTVIGMLLFLPAWWLFLPSTLAAASTDTIVIQVAFQGLFPNLLGLILLSVAVRRIGPNVSAAFLSAVPGLATVIGLIFLGENPGLIGWLGLPILTAGILIATVWQKRA